MNPKFGWRKDKPDERDFLYKITSPITTPIKYDLSQFTPQCDNQGELGCCVGFATEFSFRFAKKFKTIFSRLFIYYNTRELEGTVNEDSGCEIRDAIKTLAKKGVCRESLCKYNILKFAKKPSVSAYKAALKHLAIVYERVPQELETMKEIIYKGYPIVFGFRVFQNVRYCYEKPYILKMPEGEEIGGHAVVIVGYDDTRKLFKIRNSWSSTWADKGHFYMPYDYVLDNNLSSDFWIIKQVN